LPIDFNRTKVERLGFDVALLFYKQFGEIVQCGVDPKNATAS
jgi:hypothetical protein